MTAPTPQSDPLGTALQQTEIELTEKLGEACLPERREISDESTAEVAKLSDSLLAAARAAKDVVSLRRRRRERSRARSEVPTGDTIREFRDAEGREWRVWPVTPSRTRGKREANLGEFEHGWLAFETLDESARRRLPNYPVDWMDMPDAGLQDLLRRAVEPPSRRTEAPSRPPKQEPPPA
jgi:hypothetical protein